MGTLQKQDVPDCLRGENQWETNENVSVVSHNGLFLHLAVQLTNFIQLVV